MKLLFICTHNRCRSILAEAITNHVANGKITAMSAGSSPEGAVHPLSLHYLNEHQIQTDGLESQSWDEFEHFAPDAILTMCDSAAAETCPIWFDNSVQVHWGLQDPSRTNGGPAEQRASFKRTIHIIEQRIQRLLENDISVLKGAELKQKLESIAAQVH